MKNIAIIGLSGNPPTKGHVSMGEFLISEGYCDEVWYMPCYDHMGSKKLVDYKHRLKMIQLAIQKHSKLKLFDFEIKHKLSGAAYDTVKKLKEDNLSHSHNFQFVIGQDNANSFNKWYRFDELEKMISFIVLHREGYSKKGTWYEKSPHLYVSKKFQSREISSTLVRTLLSKKRTTTEEQLLSEIIDEDVLMYIIKHNLYKYIE